MGPLCLEIEGVRKSFGSRKVLRGLSLTANGGEVVVVRGANGSGKSTLLKIVAGLLRPTQGNVRLTTQAGTVTEATQRRPLVGYASPDIVFYPELSALENLLFFHRVRGRFADAPVCNRLLQRVGLRGREDDRVSAFSSGMKQRLRLAFALSANAPFLLLDEPSLALDETGVALVAEIVDEHRAAGGLILLATNDDREARLGKRVLRVA